jgi:hypothetical protein
MSMCHDQPGTSDLLRSVQHQMFEVHQNQLHGDLKSLSDRIKQRNHKLQPELRYTQLDPMSYLTRSILI